MHFGIYESIMQASQEWWGDGGVGGVAGNNRFVQQNTNNTIRATENR